MKENLESYDFSLDESALKKIESPDTGKSLFNRYSYFDSNYSEPLTDPE